LRACKIRARLRKIHPRLRKIHARLRKIRARLRKIHAHLRKIRARLRKIRARLRKIHVHLLKIRALRHRTAAHVSTRGNVTGILLYQRWYQGTAPVYLFYSICHFFQGPPTDDHSSRSQLDGEPGANFEALLGCKTHGDHNGSALEDPKVGARVLPQPSLLRATSTLPNTQPNSLWSLDVVVDGGFVVEAATGARETVTGTVDGDDGRCGQADREGRLSYCWRNCINYRQKRL